MKLLKISLFLALVSVGISSLAFADIEFNYLERHCYAVLADWHDISFTTVAGESSSESGVFNLNPSLTRIGIETSSAHQSNIQNSGTHLSVTGSFQEEIIYPESFILSPYPQSMNGLTLIFYCDHGINYTLDVQADGFRAKTLQLFRIDGDEASYEDYNLSSGPYTSSGYLPGPAIYELKVEYDIRLLPAEYMEVSGTMDFIFEATEEDSVPTTEQSWDQVKALFR